jgi:D-3-phosphoglycerate dehydrogenase
MAKTCLILKIDEISHRLNAQPSYSYLLHAAEHWLAKHDLADYLVLVDSENANVLKEISDFTLFSLLVRKTHKMEGVERIIWLTSCYPMLSEKVWMILGQTEYNHSVLNMIGEEIASVVTENCSQFFKAKKEPPFMHNHKIVIDDLVSGLNVSNQSEKVMAEAIVKAGLYPIHPIRYRQPFEIIKSNESTITPVKTPLLFSAPYSFFSNDIRNKWESLFDITYARNAPKNVVQSLLSKKEVWVTGTCPPYIIDRSLMESANKLKLIATPSTGTNHIDMVAAKDMGISVCSIKTSTFLKNIHASSEHSFALLLAMMKNLNIVFEEAKFGHWREREDEFRSVELHGRSIGLMGYGRIGSNMARYCSQFGMKVLVYDPYKVINEPWVHQVNSREELLESAKIISLHYHLTDETLRSFGTKEFNRMIDGSYFLNTARGELVDEIAMIEALKDGKLKAAAVDVISGEDNMYKWDHPVIKYARENNNLIVSPHTAGLTVDSESKAALEILNEIKTHLNLK